MGHFSPRAFAAAMSRTVTLRPLGDPPYSGSGVVRCRVAATADSDIVDLLSRVALAAYPDAINDRTQAARRETGARR
jgi:hypothetical protein